MTDDLITVFGGSGFLGQDVIRALLARGHTVRLVARHPQRPRFDRDQEKRLQRRAADIRDPAAVRDAVAGSRVVINAVSLYTQRGDLTFEAIHVRGAAGLAAAAREAGVARLLQVSGIGATLNSPSPYIRARARGEAAVLDAFPDAVMVRPASLFGAGDALIRSLAMLSRAPVIPLFGRGLTRLQPVWVEDVAGALARLADHTAPAAGLYELGGAETLRYRALVAAVCRHLGRRRVRLAVPFVLWHLLAMGLSRLPSPPLTRDQLWLMAKDNVASREADGFAALGMRPRGVREALPVCLGPPR